MNELMTVATVPAIVAMVNLAKRLGLPGRAALVLAVALGVGLNLAAWAWADLPAFTAASDGLLLGLAAAGLYDLTPAGSSSRSEQTSEQRTN